MSMLSEIKNIISNSHDEVIMAKKWNIHYRDNLYKEVYGRIWPTTHRYYFEGNPSFLTEYKNFTDMKRFPLIMLRDSFVTLSAFFLNNPKPPENFNTILLIAKEWEQLIPKTWKSNVALYSFQRPQAPKKPKKVMVLGLATSYSFWRHTVEQAFNNLEKLIPKESKKMFYLPMRERSVFGHIDEAPVYAKCMRFLLQKFGADVDILTNNNEILNVKLSKGDAYCDLSSENMLCSDNYFHHHYSSQNVGALDAKNLEPSEEDLAYPLSLYHNIHISELKSQGETFAGLLYKTKILKMNVKDWDPKYHDFLKEMIKRGELKI
ncbi:MAG: hypothetical protein KC478_14795 [Bacteriovoracaceae bacterium]|nr:hypothetical protein [Bacteriovoracaceae bacterium]